MNVWLSYMANRYPKRTALLVGVLSGLVNMGVDIDHPLFHSRAWHTPLLFGASIIAIYCLAHLGRLFFRMVLRRRW